MGRVLAPHGIKGLVKIELISDRPVERFTIGNSVTVGEQEFTVNHFTKQPNGYLVGLAEITSRIGAESLRGLEISVDRDQESLGEDEFFHDELIGFQVVTQEGKELGMLREVVSTGANDIFEVGDEQRIYLIPAIRDVVASIDSEKRLITIREIEGLLE